MCVSLGVGFGTIWDTPHNRSFTSCVNESSGGSLSVGFCCKQWVRMLFVFCRERSIVNLGLIGLSFFFSEAFLSPSDKMFLVNFRLGL